MGNIWNWNMNEFIVYGVLIIIKRKCNYMLYELK